MRTLTDHLNKEASLYRELIEILQKETEDLIVRDYKGLYDTVGRKEQVLNRIAKAAPQRLRLIKEAALRLGVTGAPGLSAVIERAHGAEKEALKSARDIIVSLIESAKEINTVNSLAMKDSLENIKKTLGFLGNFLPGGTYKQSGAFDTASIKGSRLSEGA
ncbi:MAG: flagellar protein FlgN [Deltaproteobacteria bacterium]|nr:flagellar protein FlgN [Deltaproteobacteria bacterium]